MPTKPHWKDDAAGPKTEEAESSGDTQQEGTPVPADQAESDGEKQAREMERGLDHALNRIPGG